ncbi:hypothetical protein TPHA_0G01910 [Tetrapisispora phaffii CBS 4417]|uniref:Binder of USO1 and GRH1 protein 1 n=1 Tax=Tetrapisispora phaffii (strain ATCC 24235 / CBS 4417 / NBRC 1672 / NRRL Y-8282 / UCD 70-5) TaxID=1071381 RepID=G8BVU9_TETPH|nr:hypothetical protein TPHA_0G01910 [Tetrapisispora phaffii CBS 4417]CCE64027.1 hypothetical protein TPHA_0G01910 [Tetrapisispora phaffii CBS 4417]
MSDLDAEAAKKAKLEEARKRVEELKKKKKNKNKGKKKADEKDGSDEIIPINSNEDEISINETVDETVGIEETIDDKVETIETPVSVEDGEVKARLPNPNEEEEEAPSESEDNVNSNEILEEKEDNTENAVNEREVGPTTNVETKLEQSLPLIKTEESKSEEVKATDSTPNFFGEETDKSDFMLSIEDDKKSVEIEELKKALEGAKAENKKMMFVQMDQETTIDELNDEIASLKAELNNVKRELEIVKNSSNMQPLVQQSSTPHIQLSNFNNANNSPVSSNGQPSVNVPIDRAMFNKWRDWNIDMSCWRSIGSGPIVEF